MLQAVNQRFPQSPLHILEVGAGIGTMIERLMDWDVIPGEAHLTAIEPDFHSLAEAIDRINQYAIRHQYIQEPSATPELDLDIPGRPMSINFQTADLESFSRNYAGPQRFNLVIAHAVLDLLNIPDALSAILSLTAENGLLYFTINFDGMTILEPAIDAALDRQIEELYHQTMDRRVTNGKPSGDRYTGRHLFQHLRGRNITILAAGSSDWVVCASPNGYVQDEEYFLHFIVNTMAGALDHHPELDQARFAAWIEERHRQIERGELVYIAHQIDILAQR